MIAVGRDVPFGDVAYDILVDVARGDHDIVDLFVPDRFDEPASRRWIAEPGVRLWRVREMVTETVMRHDHHMPGDEVPAKALLQPVGQPAMSRLSQKRAGFQRARVAATACFG